MLARCSCQEKWINTVAGNNSQRELTFHAGDLNGIGHSARMEKGQEWKIGDWKGGRMEGGRVEGWKGAIDLEKVGTD